ncbi:alpha-galactosidase [Paenibacillus filicis]|uniref:Alpha-galactosidase n=1 Tax=Paenibacillus filicis TaxID=669464 RepID=A0ABU9DJ63_9BACL
MITNREVASAVHFEESAYSIRLSNGLASLEINLSNGEYSVAAGPLLSWKQIRSACRWNGRNYHTGHFDQHVKKGEPQAVQDGYGKGIHLTIVHESAAFPDYPVLEQHFWLYEGSTFFLTKIVVASETGIRLNRLTVLHTESFFPEPDLLKDDQLHMLRVPYDNDKWVRYVTYTSPMDTESYEVTALFQPESRHGIILGSLNHNVWKTGIRIRSGQSGTADELELYAGAAGEMTRDSQPHGYVQGTRVASPLVFVGFYEDYRSGLEAYGRANTVQAAPLSWEGGVPLGWNSWSAAMSTLDYELYTGVSDFLKVEVQPLGFHNEHTLYINFDAFWDRLTPAEMEDALNRVRANGHKPGTYWTPFAFWGSPAQFSDPVEGTNGDYTYADILLRDAEGEILPDIAGGLAIDPTHPGALARIDWYTDKFVSEGFAYIKLDFMAHGALEGRHYDPDITTGIGAYHYGLSYLAGKLSPEVIGRPFFINLSIAPLFPYAFAHSRRISCDVFGTISDTEYLLNSLTHGWWMNDTLYRFNDPDHAVLYKSFNQDKTTRHEGRSRLTASVIAGTVLLLGDDFRQEEAAWRARTWLQNQQVMSLARLGKTFVPVEGDRGQQAADTFLLQHPQEDAVYLAVFNFDPAVAVQKPVALERIGLHPEHRYHVFDLWEGTVSEAAGKVIVDLEPAESKLLKLSLING